MFAVVLLKGNFFAVLKNDSNLTDNLIISDMTSHSFKGYPFQVELGNNSEIDTWRFPGDGN